MNYETHHTEAGDEEHPGPSKSQLKRDAHDLVALGERLVRLPAHQLEGIPLSDELRAAVDEARRITAHGGHKRQLKHIGRLMRHEDAAPIREALDLLSGHHALGVARHHQCERWRDRLLAEGDAALTELLDAFPVADRQRLRQLARGARAEAATGRPPRQARELFRALRELIDDGGE